MHACVYCVYLYVREGGGGKPRERERERERERKKKFTSLSFPVISSPAGKSRKFSLFKRSSRDDLVSGGSGRFERSSSRGKRKTSKGSSSRDSSLDGLSSDVSIKQCIYKLYVPNPVTKCVTIAIEHALIQ